MLGTRKSPCSRMPVCTSLFMLYSIWFSIICVLYPTPTKPLTLTPTKLPCPPVVPGEALARFERFPARARLRREAGRVVVSHGILYYTPLFPLPQTRNRIPYCKRIFVFRHGGASTCPPSTIDVGCHPCGGFQEFRIPFFELPHNKDYSKWEAILGSLFLNCM